MKTLNGVYINSFQESGKVYIEADSDAAMTLYPMTAENALKLAGQLIEKSLEVLKLQQIEQEKRDREDQKETTP